jgi:tagatose 1,6-diphosphate aldolase
MLEVFKKDRRFLMLALDHRGSFKKFVNKSNPEAVSDTEMIKVKKMIIDAVAEDMSGVLVDPEWGLPAYDKRAKPFLLCTEKTGYVETDGDRTTEIEYSPAELKQMGASGIKLLLYMNPEAANCKVQMATATKMLEESHAVGLPLFLEFVTYGNETAGKSRSEWVIRSVKMFLDAGIVADVFKLEYPGDVDSCAQITEMLGNTPWILLTRGEPYDVFVEQLKNATTNGAVGFLAGRAIWQEVADYADDGARAKYLREVSATRFREICRIASGK